MSQLSEEQEFYLDIKTRFLNQLAIRHHNDKFTQKQKDIMKVGYLHFSTSPRAQKGFRDNMRTVTLLAILPDDQRSRALQFYNEQTRHEYENRVNHLLDDARIYGEPKSREKQESEQPAVSADTQA